MRLFTSLTLVLILAASLSAQSVDSIAVSNGPLTLSLDQCLEIALSESPTIKVADMEITRYDYSKKSVLGQLMPNISFGATYSRTLAKQVAYMNMDNFNFGNLGGGAAGGTDDTAGTEGAVESRAGGGKSDGGIKMGLDNSYQVGFSASVPLIAPQLWKSLKLSDTQILQSLENARASRVALVSQVKSAYYGLLLAEDSRKVILESYDMAKTTADIYEKKFSVGAASEYDVLRTQVAVKNVEPDLLQSEIAVKQAKLQLTLLMGMDPTIDFEAADNLANYESTMYERALNIDRNISDNTDLRMLEIQTQLLSNQLDIHKMAWYPTLALTANYNWTSSNNGTPFKGLRWNPYSVVGVTLQLPLFEGGQRYYAIKQSQIQLDEMAWQRDNLTRSINMQVDLAVDNINKNIRQISSSSDNVGRAEKAHDIMARSFDIGAASYLDLRDSELALTQSRLAYYQSIYNYLVACTDLERLLGNAEQANR